MMKRNKFLENLKMHNKITPAELIVFKAYKNSIERKSDCLIFDTDLWTKAIKGLVEILRKANIKTILITAESISLMNSLNLLEEQGCKVVSLGRTNILDEYSNTNRIKIGIRVKIN